jgi:HAD superfamily hydrolase (TIGR01509 family)
MDGTLVDSEPYTALAVESLCQDFDCSDAAVDCSEFDGLSWDDIATRVSKQVPDLLGKSGLAARLHEHYHTLLTRQPPPPIRMARETVVAAHKKLPTAIVSSSFRESIAATIDSMAIQDYISFYAGVDDYEKAKPAPDGYLLAAMSLQVEPCDCLVFEDSVTGLQAARNAGMQVVAITQGAKNPIPLRSMCDLSIADYSELPDEFFACIATAKVPA